MPTLVRISGVKVSVYGDDHLPPHFHIRTADEEALVKIEDLTVIAGSISARTRRDVWPWIEANIADIRAMWNELHPQFPAQGGEP